MTKIFLLTHEYQTLVREITTPHLSSFITTCLTIVSPRSSSRGHSASARAELLATILEAFCHLLPRHPTLFRPFTARFQALLLPLLAPTPSTMLPLHEPSSLSLGLSSVSADLLDTAQRLFVLLHCCAPKNTSGEEWRKAIRTTIADIHHTGNKVFRAVIEDWEATAGSIDQGPESSNLGEQVSDMNEDLLGLPSWQGISAGLERLCGLLALLKAFISTLTSSTVCFPLGPLMDMLARIFSLVVPSKQASADRFGGPRLNPETERDEREGLWAGLPHIHVAALSVISALAVRLNHAFAPLAQGALDQITWVFAAEKFNVDIRIATYALVARLLKLIGPSLTRSSVSTLVDIVKACCDELLPSSAATVTAVAASTSQKGNGQTKGASTIDTDAFLTSSDAKVQSDPISVSIYHAASTLLQLFLTEISSHNLLYPLRVQIDRTAVLTRHKHAMIASVLNPPPNRKGTRTNKSILPLLVRSFGTDLEVEGLLRPRMPIIQVGKDVDEGTDWLEGHNDEYTSHSMGLEDNHADATTESKKENYPPDLPTLVEPSARRSEPTTLDRGLSTAAEIGEDVTNLTNKTVPFAQSSDTDLYNGSHKRHRELAEADITTTTSGQSISADNYSRDAPSQKRVRLEDESTGRSSVQVSDVEVAATRAPTSYGEEVTHPDVTSRNLPVSASSTAPGFGGGSDDSDDDIEIPPLVMDSDTDEGEDEEEGDGV